MGATRTDEEILQEYINVLGNLKDMINQDVMVLITNRTHYLAYFPGIKMNTAQEVGVKFPEDDPLPEIMRKGENKINLYGPRLFGFPFVSVYHPIRNGQGEVIGCVGVARSLEKEHKLEEISQGLASTMEQVNASLQQVAEGAQGLSGTLQNVIASANESSNKIQEINKVITAITDISTHSNLLGLNAAIEAARAGEQGRGFAVVAEEMRKLASQSKESAMMVTQILTEMKDAISGIISEINQVGGIAENQAAAMEEISAALCQVSDSSQELMEFSKIQQN